MSPRIVWTLVLLFSFLFPLQSQSILVSFFEGGVEYRADSGWRAVEIGDELPRGSEVRLAEDAYLEVLSGRHTVRYTDPGRYRLGGEADEGAATDTDVRGILRGKLSRLAGRERTPSREATTAGVRASEAATEPELDWAGDETPEELLAEGRALLEEGEFEEASFVFEEAFDFSFGKARNRAGFFFVYSLYLLDEGDFAREVLAGFSPDSSADYYADYALVAAELYLRSGENGPAAELLGELIESRPDLEFEDPLTAQLANYLFGLALTGRNGPEDRREARERFSAAVEIAPSTAVAEDARARLE